MTDQLDPNAKKGSPKLATGANHEKAQRNRGGAMLTKKLKTDVALKGAARHTAKTPADKCLRNQMPLNIAWRRLLREG